MKREYTVKARTHGATYFTTYFVARNVAEVERDSTAAIWHAIFGATISGVDTRRNLAIARNIARNVAPCVRAFSQLVL